MEATAAKKAHLRLIDGQTGEVIVNGCPNCHEHEALLGTYEKDLRIAKGRLTRLENAMEAEDKARRSELWAEAGQLHTWWALATGHEGTTFKKEEFDQATPRLKDHTPVEVLQAIAGIAYDPYTTKRKNGTEERHDSWRLLMTKDKLPRYMQYAPRWPADEHHWKFWLLERIEGRFRDGND